MIITNEINFFFSHKSLLVKTGSSRIHFNLTVAKEMFKSKMESNMVCLTIKRKTNREMGTDNIRQLQ